jgi:hypothetical protein
LISWVYFANWGTTLKQASNSIHLSESFQFDVHLICVLSFLHELGALLVSTNRNCSLVHTYSLTHVWFHNSSQSILPPSTEANSAPFGARRLEWNSLTRERSLSHRNSRAKNGGKIGGVNAKAKKTDKWQTMPSKQSVSKAGNRERERMRKVRSVQWILNITPNIWQIMQYVMVNTLAIYSHLSLLHLHYIEYPIIVKC